VYGKKVGTGENFRYTGVFVVTGFVIARVYCSGKKVTGVAPRYPASMEAT
jgi:hypothetical protein